MTPFDYICIMKHKDENAKFGTKDFLNLKFT